MGKKSKLEVYEEYALMEEGWIQTLCEYINEQCSLNSEMNVTLIEPGCGPGVRGAYFIKYLNFSKYFGIDNEMLNNNLFQRFEKKLSDTFKRFDRKSFKDEEIIIQLNNKKEIHLIKRDFLEWDITEQIRDGNEMKIIISSFFLHWLKRRWLKGINKILDLHPNYVILIGGGMPSFPIDGLKHFLSNYKKEDLFEEDTIKWFKFLFLLQKEIECNGVNLDRGLSAQDYLSRVEILISNGCNLNNFRFFFWEKILKIESIKSLYELDPLNLLPISARVNASAMVTKFTNSMAKNNLDSIKWRYLVYVAILRCRETH